MVILFWGICLNLGMELRDGEIRDSTSFSDPSSEAILPNSITLKRTLSTDNLWPIFFVTNFTIFILSMPPSALMTVFFCVYGVVCYISLVCVNLVFYNDKEYKYKLRVLVENCVLNNKFRNIITKTREVMVQDKLWYKISYGTR